MNVLVGSENPAKIDAARAAFATIWPDETHDVRGIPVDSGVPDQPMSDDETLIGAQTRARSALEARSADFGVGMEGGLAEIDGRWFNFGWVVVRSAKGVEGSASTVRMPVPEAIVKEVKSGRELGDVNDEYFSARGLNEGTGFVGTISGDILTRPGIFRDATVLALARFVHEDLF